MVNPDASADNSKESLSAEEASQIRFTDEPTYEVIRREVPLEPEEAEEEDDSEQ